jgi:hypothetical protein
MNKFLILLILAFCAHGQTGLGKSTITCLDKDGDGYGVGPGCLGPDADDNDSSIHTGAQAISKYGNLAAFLSHRGYTPTHIWYLAPAAASSNCNATIGSCVGDNSTGVEDDINHPFQTWAAISAHVAAGHMVMMRDNWNGNISYPTVSGASGSPVIYMSFPGEAAYLNPATYASAGIYLLDVSWIMLDGIRAINGACFGGGSTVSPPSSTTFHDNVFRNLECVAGGGGQGLGGFAAFNGLVNITIEDSVFHDDNAANEQHEIYLGSRTIPSSNVTVHRIIAYNSNSYPIIQFNGRVTNLVMEQNLVYSGPGTSCFSWMEGVSNSFLRNNLCFNAGAEGLALVNYDGDCYIGSGSSGICPYDQTGNVIENNTFYIGALGPDGATTVQPAIEVVNLSSGCPTPAGSCVQTKVGNLGGNTFRNNIFVSNAGGTANYPPVLFPMCTMASELNNACLLDPAETTLATTTFVNNIFWNTGGHSGPGVVGTGPNPGYGYTAHACAALAAGLAISSGCINADPLFVAASPSAYYATPSSFNLALNPGSPAIGAGTNVGAPAVDIWGNPRANPPSIGASEPIQGCSIAPPSFGPWTIGQAINQTFSNSGCSSSSWSSSGAWPTGLSFNASTGILSGTISGAPGTFTPSVAYNAATSNYSITVNAAPSITTSSLPSGTVGAAYSQSLTASGGTLPLIWSISSGAAPAGTSLSNAGVMSGTPATGGVFSFTVLATDSNSVTVNKPFSVTIAASSGSPTSGSVGVTDLSNTQLQNVCPPNNGTGGPNASYANYPFSQLCYAQYNAWSSGAIDTSRHRLIIKGGGHSDYHGNEVYALNYTGTPTLTRITNPDPWCNAGMPGNTDNSYCGGTAGIGNSSCGSGAAAKDCWENENNSPVARHTFGCLVYLPTQDAIFSFEGTYPSGTDRGFTWWLQFSGNGGLGNASWVAKDPVNGLNPLSWEPSSSGAMCEYDSLNDTVIVAEITTGFLLKYTPSTNTYSWLNEYATQNWGAMQCAFDSAHNKLFCMGVTGGSPAQFQSGYVDMSGSDGYVFHDTSSTVAASCGGMGVQWPGFDFDALTSKVVGYPNSGNTVYIFDPVTSTCTTRALPGYTIPAPPAISGTFGKFRYTPDIQGNFVYCGGGGVTSDCVSLQVDSSSAPPSSACDLNGDGIVNSVDVQIAINQALGVTACTTAALTGNGQCNVVDVQRIINASLGGACVTGQ